MSSPMHALLAAGGGFLEGYRAPLLTLVIALFVSWLCTPFVRKVAIQRGVMDDPTIDDRRIHTAPVPRWGGLAIFGAIVVALAVVMPLAYPHNPFPSYLLGMAGLGALIVVMGALDDLYQFPASVQALFLLAIGLAVQFLNGGAGRVQIAGIETPLLAGGGTWVDFGWLAFPITAFYIFVITKTMDTIDGMDGLAAGIAAIAGATLSVMATQKVFQVLALNPEPASIGSVVGEQPRVALIAAAIAGASLGFLKHNYNPAKIFMGTGGAQLLGFLLACISIVGAWKTAAAVALFVPIFVFGVPIIDAIIVVIRRILNKSPITQADKRHLHHSLLEKGLSQRQAVWVLYLAALTLSGAILVVVKLYG